MPKIGESSTEKDTASIGWLFVWVSKAHLKAWPATSRAASAPYFLGANDMLSCTTDLILLLQYLTFGSTAAPRIRKDLIYLAVHKRDRPSYWLSSQPRKMVNPTSGSVVAREGRERTRQPSRTPSIHHIKVVYTHTTQISPNPQAICSAISSSVVARDDFPFKLPVLIAPCNTSLVLILVEHRATAPLRRGQRSL